MAQHFKDASRCYVCLTYLEDPVSLKCGFICCLKCVNSLSRGPGGQGFVCLTCSEVSQKSDIRPKRQLARMVSQVKALEPQLRAILRMNPRLRRFQVDVTSDVDTANNHLYISEDLRRVSCEYVEQKRRVCPERFSASPCVLGSPRLTSGRHYWEVDVGTSAEWTLGVCKESVPRQEKVVLSSERGFWTVSCREKDTFQASTRPVTELMVSPGLHRLGIFLDFEMGNISFYDVGHGSHIFTFPHDFCGRAPASVFRSWNSSQGRRELPDALSRVQPGQSRYRGALRVHSHGHQPLCWGLSALKSMGQLVNPKHKLWGTFTSHIKSCYA